MKTVNENMAAATNISSELSIVTASVNNKIQTKQEQSNKITDEK